MTTKLTVATASEKMWM